MTRGKRILKTVVADSHNLFRRGLSTLIATESDMEVVGEAANAAQALALATPQQVDGVGTSPIDVLVMEIGLIGQDLETLTAVRLLSKTTAVLLLAPEESAECLNLVMECGARAYMLKRTPPAQLITGIRRAALVEELDSNALSRQAPDLHALAKTERAYSRISPLTSREQEVMTLLAEGRTVREVAAELSLSIKTIEAHKLNLMRKLDIHNRASLVDYAVRAGYIALQTVSKQ
jgi:two-component system response regulator NreC